MTPVKTPVAVESVPSHGRPHSALLKIPAFGAVFLRGEGQLPEKPQKKGTEDTITLFDFLNGLSDEQQKAAFAHLKLKWDRVQGSGLYGRS